MNTQSDAFAEARMPKFSTRDEVTAVSTRVAIVEERLSHMATKSWVLGGALGVLSGVLMALWWMTQQYLAPLLQAAHP